MTRLTRRPAYRVALVTLTVLAAACEKRNPPPARTTATPTTPAETVPRVWRTVDDSPQLAIDSDVDDPDLTAAVARARETAPDARTRWRDTPPDARGAWGIKWRATTIDDGLEYLWVEPVTWSRFRVEGRLASPPQRALACGKRLNEMVAFPIEEMVDWVRYERDDFTGPRDGGFTIEAMERRFGPPAPGRAPGRAPGS